MQFDSPLVAGTLIKRYKRFLADVKLDDGREVTAHSPNTGSMLGCAEPGSRVWLRDTANPKRKYPFAWELTTSIEGSLVGINTGIVNGLVSDAIESGVVQQLQGYESIRQEVKYGQENSRIDLLLEGSDKAPCYVEIKNVTALQQPGVAIFPDAVSKRGTRHLRELQYMIKSGKRAVIFYCIQREDVNCFQPADHIDAEYGQVLRQAIDAGVEAMAYVAQVSPGEICLRRQVEIICP